MGQGGSRRVQDDTGESSKVWEDLTGSGRVWEGLGGSGRVSEVLGGSRRVWKDPDRLHGTALVWVVPGGFRRVR